MGKHINLGAEELCVRLNYNAHVALEYNRGTKWSEYLYFDPSGPRKGKLLTSSFSKEYYRSSAKVTVGRAALSFLRAHKRAYIPEDGVFEIIMEVYIMAETEGKKLDILSAPELLKVYNELAEAVGKKQLKAPFKGSKKGLLARITALQTDAEKPTLAQETAAASNAAKAETRLAGLNELRASKAASKAVQPSTTKENDMANPKKSTTKKAAPAPKLTGKKATAKPAVVKGKSAGKAVKPAAKSDKPKKRGIGAFCVDLIKAGKSNEEVLVAVKKQFPDAATSASSVAWYRNKVKSGEV